MTPLPSGYAPRCVKWTLVNVNVPVENALVIQDKFHLDSDIDCAGNRYLAELTATADTTWTLYIDLHDWSGNTASAIYDNFVVGGADTDYTLTSLGTFSGTAGQSLIPWKMF